MFSASIQQLESQIRYHKEQCNLAQLELDGIQAAQAFADNAVEQVKETIDNLEPKYLDVFKEHLLNLFNNESASFVADEAPTSLEVKQTSQEIIEKEEQTKETKKEFGSLSYYELTGKPDLRPPTYEDLASNIVYSSNKRAYVGFDSKEEAEEFRDSISEPAMIGDTDTMNGFKFEVKFYCERKYLEELLQGMTEEVEEKPVEIQTPNLEKIDGQIIYSHVDSIVYVAGRAKGRLDNYGSYLTRILDIGDKYTVSNKPSFFDSKYELRVEGVTNLEDALHLQSFNLLKEYDSKQNEKARQLWKDSRKRIHPPACRPSDKLVPIAEVELGEIVYLNSINNQYKVLQRVKMGGIDHLECICAYNSERPSLVGETSYFNYEVYRVPSDSIQIDSQFQEMELSPSSQMKQEEVLTEDVNIYIPKPKTQTCEKPIEVPLVQLTAGDTVHRNLGDSVYEVIGMARHENKLVAECKLISSTRRALSVGNTYFFSDGLYLVEEESVKPAPFVAKREAEPVMV